MLGQSVKMQFDSFDKYQNFKAALGNYIYRNSLDINILSEVESSHMLDEVIAVFSLDTRPPEVKRGYSILAITPSQDS